MSDCTNSLGDCAESLEDCFDGTVDEAVGKWVDELPCDGVNVHSAERIVGILIFGWICGGLFGWVCGGFFR